MEITNDFPKFPILMHYALFYGYLIRNQSFQHQLGPRLCKSRPIYKTKLSQVVENLSNTRSISQMHEYIEQYSQDLHKKIR